MADIDARWHDWPRDPSMEYRDEWLAAENGLFAKDFEDALFGRTTLVQMAARRAAPPPPPPGPLASAALLGLL